MKHIRNPDEKCVACCVLAIEDGDPKDLSTCHETLLLLEQEKFCYMTVPGLTAVKEYFSRKRIQSGFLEDATHRDISQLLSKGRRVIAEINGSPGHAIVVLAVQENRVVIMDPDFECAERSIAIDEFSCIRTDESGRVMNCCWIQL